MNQTVIQYVLSRLKEHGVTDVFGGTRRLRLSDSRRYSRRHPRIEWRGSCNELNAGYSADGYSRIKGPWGGRRFDIRRR